MTIVLPMAGLSSRFSRAGYELPKYMLPLHGAPVFDHVLIGFAALFSSHDFLFICRDVADTPAFVRDRAAALGLPARQVRVAVLQAPTTGQAETVAKGLRAAGPEGPGALTIFNIDTFRPGFTLPDLARTTDGYLEVFHAPGTHWSFVEPGPDGLVRRVAEKQRISDLCSTGLYHFSRMDDFLSAFDASATEDLSTQQGGERYVAPLYNRLIAGGRRIGYHLVGAAEVQSCGTPDEYRALQADPPPTAALLRHMSSRFSNSSSVARPDSR